MHEHEEHPLVKEVPGHLFQFEEKIFGMSLTQFLCDIGAGIGILSITAGLPPLARLVVSALLAIPGLVLVHGKAQEQTLLFWLYLYGRQLFVPRRTTWQSLDQLAAAPKRKGRVPPLQTTWIALDSLDGGIAGYSEQGSKGSAHRRYWVVLECEGRNIRYLPEADQVQVASYEPLLVQKQALSRLVQTPRLASLQRESIAYQERHLRHCTITR